MERIWIWSNRNGDHNASVWRDEEWEFVCMSKCTWGLILLFYCMVLLKYLLYSLSTSLSVSKVYSLQFTPQSIEMDGWISTNNNSSKIQKLSVPNRIREKPVNNWRSLLLIASVCKMNGSTSHKTATMTATKTMMMMMEHNHWLNWTISHCFLYHWIVNFDIQLSLSFFRSASPHCARNFSKLLQDMVLHKNSRNCSVTNSYSLSLCYYCVSCINVACRCSWPIVVDWANWIH